jgi:4-hydroxythreonine-4-phosphate dehydrogenase
VRSEPPARAAPLALTMGDPAGIGLEIAILAWRARQERGLRPFVLFADPAAVTERAHALGLPVPIEEVAQTAGAETLFPLALPVRPVPLHAKARAGEPDPANAAAVIASIELATEAVVSGAAAALVTNPIAKSVLYAARFPHPGHTEFLAALAERHAPGRRFHPVMMLAAPELRVVPLTVHMPLAEVPRALSRGLIFEAVRTTWEALRRDFAVPQPRIALTGLNPHAGEGGALGAEERDVIAPAILELQSEGLAVTGPHPADTLFHAAARRGYDAVIAMYHDQALIPIKTLAFDTAVNVTLGLPFVRTSPDHGTAFDIAGRGCASAESLIAALKLAHEIAARRAEAA